MCRGVMLISWDSYVIPRVCRIVIRTLCSGVAADPVAPSGAAPKTLCTVGGCASEALYILGCYAPEISTRADGTKDFLKVRNMTINKYDNMMTYNVMKC